MKWPIPVICLAVLASLFVGGSSAFAGAKVQISNDSSIDLGFRLQSLYLRTERDLDTPSDGNFETVDDFKVRRARIRLGADITKWVSMFLQTEFAEEGGTGADMRVIDAFIQLKPDPLANIYLGENMAPVLRQNLTSSGGLMAVDRPGINYKNLTWGGRALAAFANTTIDDTDSGLRGDVDVRDTGLTLFGSTSLDPTTHIKYYAGIYDGIQESDEDSERYAARVQLNLFDAESGYYNLSTYLGQKKTLGFGFAVDAQADVADEAGTGRSVDYAMWTLDVFADFPVGPGALTFEAAYIDLDLDDAAQFRQAQGDGFYFQTGYFINNFQPWLGYETWSSDGPNDQGSFDTLRLGVSYFIKGHNANIKLGYENFSADSDFTGTNEDSIDTLVTGLYVTY